MKIISYLIFDGNCQEALVFYQHVFEAPAPEIMRFSEMPPDPNFVVPEEAKNLILHAELRVGPDTLYLSDNCPGLPVDIQVGDRMWITLGHLEATEATRIYNRLKEGGAELMPLQATFWSAAYGMIKDRFGIKWMINADPATAA